MSVKLIKLLSLTKREFSDHADENTALYAFAHYRMSGGDCANAVCYEIKPNGKYGRKLWELGVRKQRYV